MEKLNLKAIIRDILESPDNFIIGFADVGGLVDDTYKYGIVIGQRLDNSIVGLVEDGPTPEYFNHYKAVNTNLSTIIHKIGGQIVSLGYECKIIEPSEENSELKYKDYESTLRTPVSHKMIATRAGLGWIGKTDLFISTKFGPRLRLVSLLTDYLLNPMALPINKSKCGNCEKCVVSCPANAATGQPWDINTDRDIFFDAHKCRAKCRELTKKHLNLDSYSCGICVSVCPIGKK